MPQCPLDFVQEIAVEGQVQGEPRLILGILVDPGSTFLQVQGGPGISLLTRTALAAPASTVPGPEQGQPVFIPHTSNDPTSASAFLQLDKDLSLPPQRLHTGIWMHLKKIQTPGCRTSN